MERQSANKIVYLVALILVLFALGYVFYAGLVGADPLGPKPQESKTIDFGGDVGEREVSIAFSGTSGKISVKKSIFFSCSYSLVGFEKTASIGALVSIGSGKIALEISAPVGVHSENRQYFTLDQNLCPQPLQFVKNGAIDYNVYSDQPSFLLEDFNSDGWLDIGVEFRDYDKNPLEDGIREIYLYNSTNSNFEFSRNENY